MKAITLYCVFKDRYGRLRTESRSFNNLDEAIECYKDRCYENEWEEIELVSQNAFSTTVLGKYKKERITNKNTIERTYF